MASFKLNIAIAALVAEAQLSTVEKLFAFLGEKIEVDDDMKGYFEEFKAVLKTDQEAEAKAAKKGAKTKEEKADKPKRAPSAYNLYIRDKMADFKAAGHSGNLMKMAIEAWNEEKGATKESSSDAEEKAKAKGGPKAASQKKDKETSSDTEETKVKAKKEPKTKTKTKKEPKAAKEEAATEESDKDYE